MTAGVPPTAPAALTTLLQRFPTARRHYHQTQPSDATKARAFLLRCHQVYIGTWILAHQVVLRSPATRTAAPVAG